MKIKRKKKYRKMTSILSMLALVSSLMPAVTPIESHASEQVWNFGYTGNAQIFTVPYTGRYQLEVWGSQGGSTANAQGGKGGYSKGEIALTEGQVLQIFVGGTNGYNGGGQHSSQGGGNGGGATDIRLNGSSLTDRIIVAGGGGGAGSLTSGKGGNGGGLTGGNGGGRFIATGGTQISGGVGGSSAEPGTLGKGGNAEGCGGAGGGGGGYYGGGGGATDYPNFCDNDDDGGGGGSGYIGGVQNGQTIAGDQSMTSPSGGTEVGHAGNGYARITAINTPPSVTVTSPSPNAQYEFNSGASFTLTGTISDPDNQGTMSVKYSIDNGSPITIDTLTDTSDNQNYSTTVTLPNNLAVGNHTLSVWGEDSQGGVGTKQNIPFSIVDTVSPQLSLTQSNSDYTNQNITITATASDNQGIKRIKTPDGNWVSNSTVNYVVTQNGTYTFIAEDLSGNQTTQSITIGNIDKTPPTLTLTPSTTSWVKDNVVINVTASDVGSGVKQIKLPDGSLVNGESTSYMVSSNGSYSFVVQDNAGNQTTKTITISNIDTTPPTAPTITPSTTSWTNQNVTFTVGGASDSQSGISKYQYQVDETGWVDYTGTVTISTEGTHTITARAIDEAGNISSTSTQTIRIDKSIPIATITPSTTDWTNGNVTLNILASDELSGVKQIQRPDGTWVNNSSTSYTVTQNGTYTFAVVDNVGNKLTQSITVSNIDKTAPALTVTPDTTTWTNGNVTLTANASDTDSGVKRIQLPDGNWINGNVANYVITQNGTYTFVAEDNVGNRTTKTITVSNVDKTEPTAPSISNNQSWVNASSVTVTMSAGTDTQSGVNRVEYKLEGATNQGWTKYSGAFQVTNEGETKITARTVDNVGQVSGEVVSFVRIDRSSPYNIGITIKLKP